MHYDTYKYAKENKLLKGSAIQNPEFREFFESVKIKTVVEIGTFRGISAAYMAQFAKTIFTFDIEDLKEKYKVWDDLGITERVHYCTVKSSKEIRQVLSNIKFDFAFIDDDHLYETIKENFDLVCSCGKVLLHDVAKIKKFPGAKKFADEIGAKITGNIAYWIK
jgi:predicted O-methyltransferase YrrM